MIKETNNNYQKPLIQIIDFLSRNDLMIGIVEESHLDFGAKGNEMYLETEENGEVSLNKSIWDE